MDNPKKRARAPKPKLRGNKIEVIDEKFVCTHTGDKVAHGLVLPQTTGCVFRDLPSAFTYARDNMPPEEADQIAEIWCKTLEQVVEQVPHAPARNVLANFGGRFTYEQAFPQAEVWKTLTEQRGVTPAQWRENKKRKPKAAKKDSVTLSKGVYLIVPKGGIGGIKRVIEAGEQESNEEVKKTVKLEKAMADPMDFRAKQAKALDLYSSAYFETAAFCGLGSLSDSGNAEHHNDIASRVAQQALCGPVMLFVRRKTKIDL